MRNITIILFTIVSYALPFAAFGQFQYISPKPGSLYHNPETNIILKNGNFIDEKSLNASLINISGSLSGVHTARIVLSDDRKTIVIYPSPKFSEGEEVNVTVSSGFRLKDGSEVEGTSFNFFTHPPRTLSDLKKISDTYQYLKEEEYEQAGIPFPQPESTIRDTCQTPDFTITSTGNEYTGDVFYYNFHATTNGCLAKTIISNSGDSIFTSIDNEKGLSFTINNNGYLTYYSYADSGYEMMDSSYNVVKLFLMGNGYRADEHDFLVYPNGHSFLIGLDVQPGIDLTAIGGLDSVTVAGCVVQELDADQNVIFQWRSWDYFQYEDAVFWVTLSSLSFDWVHANSLDLDFDGNLLLSCRNMCEITKIDLSTGDIMWRFGGENNQFTFVDDPDSNSTGLNFSGQHDFKRLPNGHYTMFNNSNNVPQGGAPIISRAKEYVLDQVNKVATVVWSYQHPPVGLVNVFGPAMGSVQRLPNGNTLIDWGLISTTFPQVPRFSEVDSLGNIVWEFNFTGSDYYISYRAFKYDWNRCVPPPDSSLTLTYISSDSASFTWSAANFNTGYIFLYKLSSSSNYTAIPITTNSITLGNLVPNSIYQWQVQSVCSDINDSSTLSSIQEFNTLPTISELTFGSDIAFTLYPNPAGKVVNLSFMMKESIPLTARIVNLVGKKILEESWDASSGFNQKAIATDQLAAGVYFVDLTGDNVSVRRQLVIR